MTERIYLDTQYQPSLEDFKKHLRLTSDDLDDALQMYLLAAVNAAEHHIGKVIALSDFSYTGPLVSLSCRTPLREVAEVKVDGAEVGYDVRDGVLTLAEGVSGDVMTVRYTSGMNQVPFDIKAAIMLMAAKLFNNPVDSVETLPSQAKNLLRPYRSYGMRDNGE